MTAPTIDYASSRRPRTARAWLARLNVWQSWVALALWLAFGGFTLFAFAVGSDGGGSDRTARVVMTTAATALGPMTGAVSRGFQGCCLRASVSLLPYCLPALLAGALVQWLVPPGGVVRGTVRVIAWVVGLIVWFGGGILSLGHALG